jgi:hypothetical protein
MEKLLHLNNLIILRLNKIFLGWQPRQVVQVNNFTHQLHLHQHSTDDIIPSFQLQSSAGMQFVQLAN